MTEPTTVADELNALRRIVAAVLDRRYQLPLLRVGDDETP